MVLVVERAVEGRAEGRGEVGREAGREAVREAEREAGRAVVGREGGFEVGREVGRVGALSALFFVEVCKDESGCFTAGVRGRFGGGFVATRETALAAEWSATRMGA